MNTDQIIKILEKMPFKEGIFLKGEVMIDLQNGILIKKIKKTTLRLIKHVNICEIGIVEVTEEAEEKSVSFVVRNKDGTTSLIFFGLTKEKEQIKHQIEEKINVIRKKFDWKKIKESEGY